MSKQEVISLAAVIGVYGTIVGAIVIGGNNETQRVEKLASQLSDDVKIEQITLDKAEYYVKGNVENSKSPFFIVFYGKGGDVEYKITYNVDEKTYAKLVKQSGKSSEEYSRDMIGNKNTNKILRGVIETFDPFKTATKTYEEVIEYSVPTGDLKNYKIGIDEDFYTQYDDVDCM